MIASARCLVLLVGVVLTFQQEGQARLFLRQMLDEDAGSSRRIVPLLLPISGPVVLPGYLGGFPTVRLTGTDDAAIQTAALLIARAVETATGDGPPAVDPSDAAARDLLGEVLTWRLGPTRWWLVEQMLRVLDAAVDTGDRQGVREATSDLELLNPRWRRGAPEPDAHEITERLRRNVFRAIGRLEGGSRVEMVEPTGAPPAPRWTADEELRADALDTLRDATRWMLPDEGWAAVESVTSAMSDALWAGEMGALRAAVSDLELAGPMRAASPRDEVTAWTMPEPLRDRIEELIDAVRSAVPEPDRP